MQLKQKKYGYILINLLCFYFLFLFFLFLYWIGKGIIPPYIRLSILRQWYKKVNVYAYCHHVSFKVDFFFRCTSLKSNKKYLYKRKTKTNTKKRNNNRNYYYLCFYCYSIYLIIMFDIYFNMHVLMRVVSTQAELHVERGPVYPASQSQESSNLFVNI